jgi:hypothetical protein
VVVAGESLVGVAGGFEQGGHRHFGCQVTNEGKVTTDGGHGSMGVSGAVGKFESGFGINVTRCSSLGPLALQASDPSSGSEADDFTEGAVVQYTGEHNWYFRPASEMATHRPGSDAISTADHDRTRLEQRSHPVGVIHHARRERGDVEIWAVGEQGVVHSVHFVLPE